MDYTKIDQRNQPGPFDIIGDVHGCFDELQQLLEKLDYRIFEGVGKYGFEVDHPENRKIVLLGDLVDRGPKIVPVLKLAMALTSSGRAYCLAGNHEDKLLRKLLGRNVQIKHGLAESLRQLAAEPPEFTVTLCNFLQSLPHHLLLDNGKLVVAHAGMKESYQGQDFPAVRQFALFGEVTGETDPTGLPVRANWARDYHGQALVVYGHTPVIETKWENNTVDIDTGCVFGGQLTALCYPELRLVAVPALATYYTPARPFIRDTETYAVSCVELPPSF
ncbi:MAG TPA: metallophosphoesterase [Bacillota bacterium]